MEGAATVSIDAIGTALVSGLNEAAVGMIGVVADMIPIATTVMAAILVVGYGIKVFKKVTGR